MSVSALTAYNQTGTTTSSTSSSGYNKTDFLLLLTKQLQYQDPLNPSDSSQFMSQLAQMTQVESLQNIQKLLESSTKTSTANQWFSAIGKKMQVQDVNMTAGDQLVLSPSSDYDTITVTMKDQTDGSTVTKTFNKGDALTFTAEEKKAYQITGLKATLNGDQVACDAFLYRVIEGVQNTDAGTVLIAGDGKMYDASTISTIIQ
jgi:flagellar hook assembly protein FlgD